MIECHASYYTGRNSVASGNLHGVAFFPRSPCEISAYMARKHKSYIKEWRDFRGYTQKQVIERLAVVAGEGTPEDPELQIPKTEASLSRIENGRQNFKISLLEALAAALDVPEPGWLLSRNPTKAGEVVSIIDRLDDKQAAQAASVLKAMFGA